MKLTVTVNGIAYAVEVEVEEERRQLGSIVIAPLAGSVFKILVNQGDEIEAGQVLLILEAMKMETEITAPNAGVVTAVHVAVGDSVQGGQALVEIE